MSSTDFLQACEHLQRVDPKLAQIITVVGPPQLRSEPQGFVALVDGIISQQISGKAAAAILSRVESALGEISPSTILQHTSDSLKALGLSRQKSLYLLDLATKVEQQVLDLNTLDHQDDETIIAHLTQVKGIGRWTAQMYLIFSLGRPNVLPVDDLGLRQAMRRIYELTDLPKRSEFEALATPWHPHCTIACWYLWRSLDLPKDLLIPIPDKARKLNICQEGIYLEAVGEGNRQNEDYRY